MCKDVRGSKTIELIKGIKVCKYSSVKEMVETADTKWHLENSIEAYVDGQYYTVIDDCGRLHWGVVKLIQM